MSKKLAPKPRRTKQRSVLLSATFSATMLHLLVAASPARSQTEGASTPAPQSGAQPASNDIVVTARRREENVQKVPVAITAFSQKSLERKAISDPFSLNKAVPGLQVDADSGNNALPSFAIRGRGQYFGAASGSVETYFADVPLSAPFQIPTLPPQFFDLQSLQVLKGPQGTLFGRNTTGGAVLFVPQAPTDQFGGYVRVQGGTHNDFQFEAAVNLPFSDKVMLRVAAFEWYRKGYTKVIPFATTLLDDGTRGPDVRVSDPKGGNLPDQRVDNENVTEARATLLLKPTESFTNSTIFTYHTDKNRSTERIIAADTEQPSFYGALAAASYADYATSSLRTVRGNVDLTREPSSTFAVINTSTLELSDTLTIKNIFGYINARGYGNNPGSADGFPSPAIDLPAPVRQLRNYQTTDELQFQGNLFDNRLTYIFGGLIDMTREPGSNSGINIVTNSFPAGDGSQYDEQFRQSRYTSESVFASATYKITDKLSISAGIRHSWDHIGERSCEYNPYPTQSDATACSETPHFDSVGDLLYTGFITGKKTFQGFSYNASLDWHLDNMTLVYGGYRRGYKRGGFDAKGTGLSLFGPEKVDDFYIGVKKELNLGGIRGHINVEGFWDNYKGAQRSYDAFDPSVGAITTAVQNAPKQTYRGFDTDLDLDITPWFEFSANYTFVDAYYGKWPDNTCNIQGASVGLAAGVYCFNILGIPGGPSFVPVAQIQALNPGDQSVNPVGLVSRNKFSVTARFHHQLSDGGEIAIAPTLNYQSRFYFDDAAIRQPNAAAAVFGVTNSLARGVDYAPGYKTVDIRVEWNKFLGSRFDLAANVTNLTNKTFITGGANVYELGVQPVVFGAPRMIYAEVKFHF